MQLPVRQPAVISSDDIMVSYLAAEAMQASVCALASNNPGNLHQMLFQH